MTDNIHKLKGLRIAKSIRKSLQRRNPEVEKFFDFDGTVEEIANRSRAEARERRKRAARHKQTKDMFTGD